jgi:alpha-N-arabinofuranosidase
MLRAAMAAVFAAHCAAGLHPLPEEPLHFALGASSGAAAGWAGPQILPPPGAGAAAAAAADDWNASVTLDLGVRRPISPNLFGIFWEEIGHAGDGGLYAELVQDRSYDALAYAAGFLSPSRPATDRLPVDLAALAASHRCSTDRTLHAPRGGNQSFRSRRERPRGGGASDGGAIVAWRALPGTQTALTKSVPLNEQNLVALEVTAPGGPAPGGLLNGGFWGIAVAAGERYSQSLYLRNLQVDAVNVTVSLVSANLSRTYATFAFTAAGGGGDMWARHEVEARSRGTDPDARLMVRLAD